jgi:putative DNA primase/helicase
MADALEALSKLQKPFSEFPFVGEEDRSVVIAAGLTAIQRRLLAAAPLFAFTAPTQRTGKSLLAECVAIIGIGKEAPAMAASSEREEMRKALTAVLREGHAIVNLDNIDRPLYSPDLSRAITQGEYQDRILGENKTIRVPTNLLWTATGNNLLFCGDLAVRALLCRLDAKAERPEERHFGIDNLKAYMMEHRRQWVAAALTILRAYALAGRPDQELIPWGGFDEWSKTIRAPLVWLGMADPCATRRHVIEDDPDRELAIAVLTAWRGAFEGASLRMSEVIERANSDGELKSALLSVANARHDAGNIDPRRLGQKCRDWKDRVVGGLRLEHGSAYGSHTTWVVKDCRADSADNADRFPSKKTEQPPAHPVNATQPGDGQFLWGETNGTNGTNGKDGDESEGVRV